MSETVGTADDQAEPTAPKGLKVREEVVGQSVFFAVEWVVDGGATRTGRFKRLTLGDQFDLAEMTGDSTGGRVFSSMAQIGYAIRDLDGVPCPPLSMPLRREEVKQRLDALGMEGYVAGLFASNGYRDDAAVPPTQNAQADIASTKN